MICISHLLPDEEMKEFTQKYGTGIESIDFSISDNLDHLSETVENYRKKMESYWDRCADSSWAFSGYQSLCL